MNGIENLVIDPKRSKWFEKGMDQREADSEMESINIYDKRLNIVHIVQRSTGQYVTTCQPNKKELED